MAETSPHMEPGGVGHTGSSAGAGGTVSMPSATPPSGAVSAAAQGTCGCSASTGGGMMTANVPMLVMASMGDAAPSLRPAEGISTGISAWQNNKRITGLWSINQNRNSWVYVDTVGWKKLANNSDSAIVALSMLGAHAREKSSVVNYREESDGMIREMYVW